METGAKSKIPGMSMKKSGCGGEVVSVVTAAAHLGSAWKTESTGSITLMHRKVHKAGTRVQLLCTGLPIQKTLPFQKSVFKKHFKIKSLAENLF